MQTNESTQQVEIYNPNSGTWYQDILEPLEVTVTDSGDPEDYYITEGKHQGKHILKSDCRHIVGWRLTA